MMDHTAVAFAVASWLLGALVMVPAWIIQRRTENAAVVDAVWCGTVAALLPVAAWLSDGDLERRILLASMGALWGLRLVGHVLRHRLIGRSEDPRYRALRERWGDNAQLYFFLLFQAEALAVPVFVLPLFLLMENPAPAFSPWEWGGIVLWGVAIVGEWAADHQLSRFRADPANRGRTLRTGLWRYSRHPNYFFEALHWWAYVVMAVGVPHGWVTAVPAVAMTASLLFLSGIPLAEAQALASRGEGYREYQRVTSAFVPWPPKRQRK